MEVNFTDLCEKYVGKRIYWMAYSKKKGIKIYCSKATGITINIKSGQSTAEIITHDGQSLPIEMVFTDVNMMEIKARQQFDEYLNFITALQV